MESNIEICEDLNLIWLLNKILQPIETIDFQAHPQASKLPMTDRSPLNSTQLFHGLYETLELIRNFLEFKSLPSVFGLASEP